MIRQGPRFTEAARAAAAAKRRERAAIKAETRCDLEVFVVRMEHAPNVYGWEIRQFGGVVVCRSARSFGSLMQARADGLDTLERLPTRLNPRGRSGASAAPLMVQERV